MIRTRSRMIAATAIAAALLFTAACSDDDGDDTASTDTEATADDATDSTSADPYADDTEATESTEATEATDSTEAAAGPELGIAEGDLGSILVDGQGITLYVFSNDTQGEPTTCTGGCAATWPALTGEVTAGEGVDETLIGTVENADGGVQATYDGWPLYYYAEDAAPGDTNGQGVGSVWWVVGADGAPIES